MRSFSLIIVVLLVGVGCLGFYLGWFHLGTESSDGKTHVTFTVDQEKIKADESAAVDKVQSVGKK